MNRKLAISLLIIVLVGVSLYSYGELKEKEKSVVLLKAKIQRLEENNKKSVSELEALKKKLNEIQEKYDDFNVIDAFLKEKREIKDRYPWLETMSWDKMVIVSQDTDDKYIFVNDERILNHICDDFLHLKYETYEPPAGFDPDIPRYTYTFIKGDDTYDVSVVDRGIVEIDGKYYVTNLNVHKLGEALMPSPNWNKPGNVDTKIASGGILVADDGVSFSQFRMQMFASMLSEATLLDRKPKDKGEKKSAGTLFSHGEEIEIECYNSYLHITDNKQEYWYRFEKAAFYFSHIFFGMG